VTANAWKARTAAVRMKRRFMIVSS